MRVGQHNIHYPKHSLLREWQRLATIWLEVGLICVIVAAQMVPIR